MKIQINVQVPKHNILLRWKAMAVSTGKNMNELFDEAAEWYITFLKSGGQPGAVHKHEDLQRVCLTVDRELLIYADKLATNLRHNILLAPAKARDSGLPTWRRMDYSWMITRMMDVWLETQGFGSQGDQIERARKLIHEARVQQYTGTLAKGRRILLSNLLAKKDALNPVVDEELRKRAEAIMTPPAKDPKPSYILQNGEK